MLVQTEVGIEAGLLPGDTLKGQREQPGLELLHRLDRHPEFREGLGDHGERGGRDDTVKGLAERHHAAPQHLELGGGREHVAHVEFLDQQVCALERVVKGWTERIVVGCE